MRMISTVERHIGQIFVFLEQSVKICNFEQKKDLEKDSRNVNLIYKHTNNYRDVSIRIQI